MSLSFRTVLPNSPIAALHSLPMCAGPCCLHPATLWQRWWARNEGIWLHADWYCSRECFHDGLERRLEQASLAAPRPAVATNRMPLGLVLLSQGEISVSQLRRALQRQAEAASGKIGEWLVALGFASTQQVTAALAVQQGCLVFRPHEPQWLPAKLHWPEPLARRYRALPVYYSSAQSLLYVGFLEQVDRSFLLCIERMLLRRTQPCIVDTNTYNCQRELLTRAAERDAVEIRQRQTPVEMTRTIGNYAEQVRADRCLLVRCGECLWARLEPARGAHLDLVFRLAASV